MARAAPRECWTVKPVTTGRVRDNVGYQGEELVYRLVAAGLRQAAPRAVYWPWPILQWSREVLDATLPAVELASGEGAEAPKACAKGEKVWRPEYKRPRDAFHHRYGHKRKKHHARLLRNTDLEYVRVCGVQSSSSLPKKESLCEGRTAAARKCALVARHCYETPLRPRSEACASSDPCECLDVLEKRLVGFFARRRTSGGRPRRRRSSTTGRGEEAL